MRRAADYLLALDAGTGSGRCVAFDARGRLLAAAQEPFEYRLLSDPNIPFLRGFDLDPDAFWGALARSARTVVKRLPASGRIRAVVATSQREGCVFLDREGTVLYAGPNLDARAVTEGMELQERVGLERLHAITGHAPPYIFPLARYLWFRKHRDGSRVATLFMLNDWITHRLSGARLSEHSNAGESMLYDVSRRAWSRELLDALDVPDAILPPLCDPGTRAGDVTEAAAAATGIPAGTPVFVGGADTESALLGSGVHQAGETAAVLGTTTPVQMVTERPILDATAKLWTSCHVVPDRWVLESNAGDTGGAYRWLLELLFGSTNGRAHAKAEAAIAACGPPTGPLVCHLGPAIFDLSNMSPFKAAGVLFRFPVLHIDRPGRADLLRAYVESVAFAVRGNCEQLVAVGGKTLERLTVSGGMTKSPSLGRILADTLGVPLARATVAESASLGCAILGAVGVGLYASLPEAVAAMTRAEPVTPDPERIREYEERYRQWREAYEKLQAWIL